jgi:hypothetical protein
MDGSTFTGEPQSQNTGTYNIDFIDDVDGKQRFLVSDGGEYTFDDIRFLLFQTSVNKLYEVFGMTKDNLKLPKEF